jgi:hypothetical protein
MNRYKTVVAGLLFLICTSILTWYANSEKTFVFEGETLKKSLELQWTKESKLIPPIKRTRSLTPTNYSPDKKRILLVGDSEAEGLMYPLNDYCQNSGHQIVKAVVWYSASDMTYAANDTLKNEIAKVKPDYIIMVIGLNQIFQQSFESSIKAVAKIKKTFGNIPYTWVGPANWVEDKGINNVYETQNDPGTFFLSKNLVMGRGKDGRHPDLNGYYIWMEALSKWLKTEAKWKLYLNKPPKRGSTRTFSLKIMNASPQKKKELQKETIVPDSMINLLPKRIDTAEVRLQP